MTENKSLSESRSDLIDETEKLERMLTRREEE
jgi:hypothetical protein